MGYWRLLKGVVLWFNMPRSLIICVSMPVIMQTQMAKQECFRRGLNTKLKVCLNLVRPNSSNELVNMAITQDNCITAHHAEKKRKAPTGPSGAQPPRYRLV